MARGLKFRIQEVEELYDPCSENKGADQLHGYREADLRLCFRICKKPVFSRRDSYVHYLHPTVTFQTAPGDVSVSVIMLQFEKTYSVWYFR